MTSDNYEQMGETELRELLAKKREALRLFRFNIAGSKIKNMKEGRLIRKAIARLLTEAHRRGLSLR